MLQFDAKRRGLGTFVGKRISHRTLGKVKVLSQGISKVLAHGKRLECVPEVLNILLKFLPHEFPRLGRIINTVREMLGHVGPAHGDLNPKFSYRFPPIIIEVFKTPDEVEQQFPLLIADKSLLKKSNALVISGIFIQPLDPFRKID